VTGRLSLTLTFFTSDTIFGIHLLFERKKSTKLNLQRCSYLTASICAALLFALAHDVASNYLQTLF